MFQRNLYSVELKEVFLRFSGMNKSAVVCQMYSGVVEMILCSMYVTLSSRSVSKVSRLKNDCGLCFGKEDRELGSW